MVVPNMAKDNEGHGFRNKENRFDFYGEMEKFFFEHLGGRIAEIKFEDYKNQFAIIKQTYKNEYLPPHPAGIF